ncbi:MULTISPECIES: type VI secretion system tip protein VgrG [unclassified Chryseobacterium]|uniref:type VI secretion system Vgr family protein n=1 Tax=unclassified Chryseobacterium TaxID=2593645 RepID=UPI00226A0F79|nr:MULTISPECIES: type VI secretion system tip protein VgrG [unclassified Chryseobacterium]
MEENNNNHEEDSEKYYNSDFGRLNHPDDLKKYFSMRSFQDFLNDPTNPIVYTTLSMDGKPFLEKSSFSVELNQFTNEHDTFTITVPDDALDSFKGYVMENSKNILGKTITINIHRYGNIRQVFVGIIANIRNRKENGYGELYITGYSPTVLMESGKKCRSFEGKSLEQIIKEIVSEYPDEAHILVHHPNTEYSLPYTVQYKESDYQFIKRLATRFGEYFYYNGQQLLFGNKVQDMLDLEENKNLIEVEFQMNIKPQHFSYSAYDVQAGENIDYQSNAVQHQYKENPFQAVAINASESVYKKRSEMFYNHTGISNNTSRELKDSVRRERENRENLIMIKGKSRDPLLKIGGLAKLIDINDNPMETYRIIELKHYHDGNEYYNEFVGIPDLENAPYQDSDAVPFGEEQSARVVDNNDPSGMGRVRVQFQWQERKGEKSPWIRLIQPHSGSGKGFHFIPEIGEEVMVGFESQNAEKPFVVGTHYNGKETSSYHTSGNDKKVIHTRSGTKIILNDGEGSVFIEDPSGNTYLMDGQGNIEVNAPNDITFTAGKNMNINVGQNMNTNVGMNSSETIGMNKSVGVGMMSMMTIGTDFITNVMGKMVEYITGNKESKVEKDKQTTINGKGSTQSSQNHEFHSQKEIQHNSAEQSKNH